MTTGSLDGITGTPLGHVLAATGFAIDGVLAPGVHVRGDGVTLRPRGRDFQPDAMWRGSQATTVYFKSVAVHPGDEVVSAWRREVWNEGFAPLLWIVTPVRVDVYNGFGRPKGPREGSKHLLQSFAMVDDHLRRLDEFAGRLALETGRVWREKKIKSADRVDMTLLADIAALERDLIASGLARPAAQALIGRTLFTQYLVDRSIVGQERLLGIAGEQTLSAVLRDGSKAEALFDWLRETFNGDVFQPVEEEPSADPRHLGRVADFLAGTTASGQTSLFPYQFDLIPVELISSIYEQFAHSRDADPKKAEAGGEARQKSRARQLGMHYTPLPLVTMILDQVTEGLTGEETVIDTTCGSGVFLVEAFRRLVRLKATKEPLTRELIRFTLYNQIFGVDVEPTAVRIASFSLYLAALELDPHPEPPEALKFEKLIGRSLIAADVRQLGSRDDDGWFRDPANASIVRRFDVIVGNPPWTYGGKSEDGNRNDFNDVDAPSAPRGVALDFVRQAAGLAHKGSRIGLVTAATTFFSQAESSRRAVLDVLGRFANVVLLNLSPLQGWLFPTAKMPALVIFASGSGSLGPLVTLVNARWSLAGERQRIFEISPNDVVQVPMDEWRTAPERLKAAALGGRRDWLLLERLRKRSTKLQQWLSQHGSGIHDGIQFGSPDKELSLEGLQGDKLRKRKDRIESLRQATAKLHGLPLIGKDDGRRFGIAEALPTFEGEMLWRPRERQRFDGPLVLIREQFVGGPRPYVSVSPSDGLYTEAHFGIPLRGMPPEVAQVLAGLMSSALASWFFLMTGGEFGIFKRRLFTSDLHSFPLPTRIEDLVASTQGSALLEACAALRSNDENGSAWTTLDDAVARIYKLTDDETMVVRDGLVRASWSWKPGRMQSEEDASVPDGLEPYALALSASVNRWLAARGKRQLRAEVIDVPAGAPIRAVRFWLDAPGENRVGLRQMGRDADETLRNIAARLRVDVTSVLAGVRELRIHGDGEFVVIKPAPARYWMETRGLADGDEVVRESMAGARA